MLLNHMASRARLHPGLGECTPPDPARQAAADGVDRAMRVGLRGALAQLAELLSGPASPLDRLQAHLATMGALTGTQLPAMGEALGNYSSAVDAVVQHPGRWGGGWAAAAAAQPCAAAWDASKEVLDWRRGRPGRARGGPWACGPTPTVTRAPATPSRARYPCRALANRTRRRPHTPSPSAAAPPVGGPGSALVSSLAAAQARVDIGAWQAQLGGGIAALDALAAMQGGGGGANPFRQVGGALGGVRGNLTELTAVRLPALAGAVGRFNALWHNNASLAARGLLEKVGLEATRA